MSELATESLVAQKIATGGYQYTITLKDTGTTTIGTFWFAWIPGEDFMPVKPLPVALPAGWTAHVIHGTTSPDGYSIQWLGASADYLHPGQSKVFHFRSSATPAEVFGRSTIFSTHPLVTTSFVYSRGPFGDTGYEFHSSSNKGILPAALADRGVFTVDAPGASTTELLGLNDHGIGDALGNTHGFLAAPAADEAVTGLAGILASSMPAVASAETFSGDFAFRNGANIGGTSGSGPALDLGKVSASEGWGWHVGLRACRLLAGARAVDGQRRPRGRPFGKRVFLNRAEHAGLNWNGAALADLLAAEEWPLLAQPTPSAKTAFSRFAPVHWPDLEGQQRGS
jgi:hypothetical protein